MERKGLYRDAWQGIRRGTVRAVCNHPFFLRQVIAPEEIVDPNVDEHSVMTYLSQFPKAKLKPGAPVRSKQLNPKKAIAYGPGMCGGLRAILREASGQVEDA